MNSQRPYPPETMFGLDGFKSFAPAPDVSEWVEATFFDPSSPVANPEHEHLAMPISATSGPWLRTTARASG